MVSEQSLDVARRANAIYDTRLRMKLEAEHRNAFVAVEPDLVVWVDTAFDGELVIPFDAIHDMELPQSAAVQATLADGTAVVLDTIDCETSKMKADSIFTIRPWHARQFVSAPPMTQKKPAGTRA